MMVRGPHSSPRPTTSPTSSYNLFLFVYAAALFLSVSMNGVFLSNFILGSNTTTTWHDVLNRLEASTTSAWTNFGRGSGGNGIPGQQQNLRTAATQQHQGNSTFVRRRRPPLPPESSFGACLLLMDENHRLTEWLAYHYHVLPLDYLVVATDPKSTTSPKTVLDRWRNEYGMTIVEWDGIDVYKGKEEQFHKYNIDKRNELSFYLQRQTMFVRNCLVHMKDVGRHWVILTDPDEYLLFNGPKGTSPERMPEIKHPSLVDGLDGDTSSGAIMKFLQSQRENTNSIYGNSSCISIPRMLFGAVESDIHEVDHGVPPTINATRLDSLRYRKHIRRNVTHKFPINGWSKSILDVSQIPYDDFPTVDDAFRTMWNATTMGRQMAIHIPVPKVCPEKHIMDEDTALRINHYVGSWEAFGGKRKNDRRQKEQGRNYNKWQEKASVADNTDDNIRPWISGFIDDYGEEQAVEMLTAPDDVD